MLTAVDSRIKAAVACAVPADRSRDSLIAPRNFARAIAPRPLLMLMGRRDELCPNGDAEDLFRAIGDSRSKLTFVEGTHRMSRDFVPIAVQWLKDHL